MITPGEWKYVLEGGFVIAPAVKKEDSHTAKGEFGEDCWKHYGGELVCETVSQADGQLIAAAPDLLAALEDVRDLIDGYVDVKDGADGQPTANNAMRAVQRIDEAIKKALA